MRKDIKYMVHLVNIKYVLSKCFEYRCIARYVDRISQNGGKANKNFYINQCPSVLDPKNTASTSRKCLEDISSHIQQNHVNKEDVEKPYAIQLKMIINLHQLSLRAPVINLISF